MFATWEGDPKDLLTGYITHTPSNKKSTDRCNCHCQPKHKCEANQAKLESESFIGNYLLSSVQCGNSYSEDSFHILIRVRSAFHLKVLEAMFIKLYDLSLCRQKELVSLCKCTEVGAKSFGAYRLDGFRRD